MRSRTPWLHDATPSSGIETLSDGTAAALLTTGERDGIAMQFADAIGDDGPVQRLIVITPYWDEELAALSFLNERLAPQKIQALIDRNDASFPKSARFSKRLELFDREGFQKGRFLHAKALIAQTRTADHALYGSANCTVAALGDGRFGGTNEEICLYRRFPKSSLVSALGLDDCLVASARVDIKDLKSLDRADEPDVREWFTRYPGRFECQFETLTWTPPSAVDLDAVTIELLNRSGQPMSGTLRQTAGVGGATLRFSIASAQERPAFARLKYRDGTFSSPAVVMIIDKIREAAREARSKRIEDAIGRVSEEGEEGLWLLEVLDTLESSEREHAPGMPPTRAAKTRADDEPEVEPSRKLSYEEFVAGRQPRSAERGVERNSLTGSELAVVRGFMNRVLGLSTEDSESSEIDDQLSVEKAFELADETSNGEEIAQTGGAKGSERVQRTETDDNAKRKEQRRQLARRQATREELAEAVDKFIARVARRKKAQELTTFDVLRLRAMLMIVAAAGYADGKEASDASDRTSLQVLPVDSAEFGWPRMIGKILFGFFGGPDPAIKQVLIEGTHDQMSDDIVECWATCFWAVQACLNASVVPAVDATRRLCDRVYQLTALTGPELMDQSVVHLIGRLNDRFCVRLGLSASALDRAHEIMTKKVRPLTSAGQLK
jgi:hypothetical protein